MLLLSCVMFVVSGVTCMVSKGFGSGVWCSGAIVWFFNMLSYGGF